MFFWGGGREIFLSPVETGNFVVRRGRRPVVVERAFEDLTEGRLVGVKWREEEETYRSCERMLFCKHALASSNFPIFFHIEEAINA
jgi:hypothetical protein